MSATFAYDALGRRTTKTINGQSTSVLYDGLDIVKEEGGAGEASYLRTLGIDEALSRTDATGTLGYLTDALGSTLALADSSGAASTTYTYAPFGETAVSGTPSANAFQFTGRENDGTGLYYYRARYYDPGRARFISEDPIGLAGGPNLFTYAANDPLVFVDPHGLIVDVTNAGPLREVLDRVKGTKRGRELYDILDRKNAIYRIVLGRNKEANFNPRTYTITIDPCSGPFIQTTGGLRNASIERILAHEMGHAIGYPGNDTASEMSNVRANENPVAIELGERERTRY